MSELISLDLETTGLDERRHEPWEVALVAADGEALCYQFDVNLEKADGEALQIGSYYSRIMAGGHPAYDMIEQEGISSTEAYRNIARLTEGKTLMGCAVHFDARFLAALLRKNKFQPAWHHRYLDLGSFVAGATGENLPCSSREMAEIIPNEYAHTALGDAHWNWEVYRKWANYGS